MLPPSDGKFAKRDAGFRHVSQRESFKQVADFIVDLVDTGNTLKANGLVPMEHVCDVSSRLIVNKASMKIKHAQITTLIERLSNVIEQV